MSEITRIIDELEREHAGDPWHGSPLKDILDGIDAAQAARRPLAGAHSIWELVLHVTGWKQEVARRTAGGAAAEPPDGDWPEVGEPTDARWKKALAKLETAHRELIAAIRALPEPKLFEATNDPRNRPLGAGVSYYVLLHGIVQHDVYHAGQIALLKKAL
ncbi:MAG TPA: DinB family protein [Vicinamibacterales bacterium]|nr:DinB family protein [Vicinamibacterales bacterium]